LDQNYGTLFAKLRLTPQQIERFKNLVVAHDEILSDTYAIQQVNDLRKNDPALAAFNQNAEREFANAQKILLGEAGYRDFQDFKRSLPARNVVDTFVGKAAVTGVPIAAEQAERLTEAFAQASPEFIQGGRVTTLDWETAFSRAETILSEAQMAILGGSLLKGTKLPDPYLQKLQSLAAEPTPVLPQHP
jgi:hypothetical protein